MTLTDTRRRWATLALGLLLALGGLLVLPPMISGTPTTVAAPPAVATPSGNPSTPTEQPQAEPECPVRELPHYYTFDPGKESKNAYGPPIVATANMTTMRSYVERRICGYLDVNALEWVGGDWALFASIKSDVDGTDRNHRYESISTWADDVNEFLPRIQWDQAELFIDNRGNTHVDSYYMIRGDDYRPDVWPDDKWEGPSEYLILPVRRRDGKLVKTMLRLECGLQPVHPREHLAVLDA
jgi:hypothetical protein